MWIEIASGPEAVDGASSAKTYSAERHAPCSSRHALIAEC